MCPISRKKKHINYYLHKHISLICPTRSLWDWSPKSRSAGPWFLRSKQSKIVSFCCSHEFAFQNHCQLPENSTKWLSEAMWTVHGLWCKSPAYHYGPSFGISFFFLREKVLQQKDKLINWYSQTSLFVSEQKMRFFH